MAVSPKALEQKLNEIDNADVDCLEKYIDIQLQTSSAQIYSENVFGGYRVDVKTNYNPRVVARIKQLYLQAGWKTVTYESHDDCKNDSYQSFTFTK